MVAASAGVSPAYVVVTPAHNETRTIQGLIKSMAAQIVLPARWVVVNDASTDDMADLVRAAQSRLPWLCLLSLKRDGGRYFSGKAHSFNAGVKTVQDMPFTYLANVDADVSFPPDYFAYLIECIESDPRIGVVGTPFIEEGFGGYDYRFSNPEHVSGACQLFRRACLEQIGGYQPIESGGIDWVAVTTARMLGWKTRTCPDRVLTHHRPMGTGNRQWGNLKLRLGRKDYMLGNGLGWQMARCLYQARYRPYVVGGLLIMVGYLRCVLARESRPISDQLVRFVRAEQATRLKAIARHLLGKAG